MNQGDKSSERTGESLSTKSPQEASARFEPKDRRFILVDEHLEQCGDQTRDDHFPITLDHCVVVEVEGRSGKMADILATHYGRTDHKADWARSLEVPMQLENYISGFFNVNQELQLRDWWLLVSPLPEGQVWINIVHVSSIHDHPETTAAN